MMSIVNKALNTDTAKSEAGFRRVLKVGAAVQNQDLERLKKKMKKSDQLSTSSVILDVGYMHASPLLFKDQTGSKCPPLLDFISE